MTKARTEGRIAWICGGYEPGCDGVGDYVRYLAANLPPGDFGEPAVLALHDARVGERREAPGVLRLPQAWPWPRTMEAAEQFLDRAQPAVLAWNFVPQIYAARGILSDRLIAAHARLRADRRLVLFMHELWCGTGREDTARNWLTGLLQRRGVLRWIERLRPDAVLTSNPAYAAVLKAHGVAARIVPLCSNIPRTGVGERAHWPAVLRAEPISGEARTGYVLAGVFGAIHDVWRPERALVELAAYARRHGKKLALVWFGRGSEVSENSWRRLVAGLGDKVACLRLGPVDGAPGSALIESCDLGLPTIQFNLLGKSGTAAAFSEHGVPLLVVSDAWTPRFRGFVPAPPTPSVARWREGSDMDWAALLAARPVPGDTNRRCLEGWRRALATEPVGAALSLATG